MNDKLNTERIFDSYAKLYKEKFMDVSSYKESLEFFEKVLPKGDLKVMDIGCGPGNISAYLLKNRLDLKIFGIDLSSKMLKLAKENIPSGDFRKLDALQINRLEEKFDATICGFCLPYLSKNETAELLHKVSAILNPGGSLYLSTMIAEKYTPRLIESSQGGSEKLMTYYHETGYLKTVLENNGFIILYKNQMEEQEREDIKFSDLIMIARKTSKSH